MTVHSSGDWRTFEALPLTPILEQALDLFNENGYHGTTVRQIARRVGVTVPALYYHHESKEAVLVALFEMQMRELNDRAEAAAREAGDDVLAQFSNVVEAIVLYMTYRARYAGLDSELRHVCTVSRSRYTSTRKRLELTLIDVVNDGVARGEFNTTDIAETVRALLGMCQSIPRWYQPGGALTPEQVAARYVDIAQHAVGHLPVA